MLAHLYHSPAGEPCGAATVGCTEACLLSGLAAKKGWQARRREAGKPTDRPNLVIGSNYQACAHLAATSEHPCCHRLRSDGTHFCAKPWVAASAVCRCCGMHVAGVTCERPPWSLFRL